MAARFGSGALRYELVEGWERLPAGWVHDDVAGVACDNQGRVYLYARGEHPVIVYDRDGTFLGSWGEGRFSYRTHGMYFGRDGHLYLVDDLGSSVGRYSVEGELLQWYGPQGTTSDAAPYNRPTNAGLAPSGQVYVSDGYGNTRVHRFSGDGELLQSWGEPGSGPGQFRTPHGIWAHDDGRVFVADRQNERLQIFDAGGGFLGAWTDVQRPQDLFVDAAGLTYVVELSWHAGEVSHKTGPVAEYVPGRLSILDPEGNPVLRWSVADLSRPDAILAPHGVWVDDEGSIYIAHVTNTVLGHRGAVPPGALTFQKFARV
ncbi:hypothetical protein [Dactylosporangium sp. CS-033363]|uniref:hypothetical protein n=1 Tax=Dactylosporangium sp. CS-033363 TaxID=3239935 RepID=UPI003D926B93